MGLVMNNQGWECSNCNRVNAPWMPYCGCHVKKSYAEMQHDETEKVIRRQKSAIDAAAELPDQCATGKHIYDKQRRCIVCLVYGRDLEDSCSHEWVDTHTLLGAPGSKRCSKCGVSARDVPIVGGWL